MNTLNTPQDFLSGITWYGKQKSYSRGYGDISIAKNKSGWCITFRNDTFKHFPSGRVMVAVSNDSVLFKDGGEGGMKFTTAHNPNVRCAKFYRKELDDLLKPFAGDYNELRYDKRFNIYYVSTSQED